MFVNVFTHSSDVDCNYANCHSCRAQWSDNLEYNFSNRVNNFQSNLTEKIAISAHVSVFVHTQDVVNGLNTD